MNLFLLLTLGMVGTAQSAFAESDMFRGVVQTVGMVVWVEMLCLLLMVQCGCSIS